MSYESLQDLVRSVGDDSPEWEKQVFRLWAAAEDLVAIYDRPRPLVNRDYWLRKAVDRLRAAVHP